MSFVLRRSSNLQNALLQRRKIFASTTKHPIGEAPHISQIQTQTRHQYSNVKRFPTIPRKYSGCPCSPATARFSSSSNTSSAAASTVATSASKVGFVSWYLGMLKSKPIVTKSVTTCLIFSAADFSSQTITKSASDCYDVLRTVRMGGCGLLMIGPCHHFWFGFMARMFPKQDTLSTLKKLFIGQTLYGPTLTTAFFCITAFLRGETNAEIGARLNRDLVPTLARGVMYWSMCDFITLRFVPVQLQVLMTNTFSYIWSIYFSYVACLDKVDASS